MTQRLYKTGIISLQSSDLAITSEVDSYENIFFNENVTININVIINLFRILHKLNSPGIEV